MAKIIDGKSIAKGILEGLKAEIARLKNKPGLAVVLVGGDPASEIYVRNKKRVASEIGIVSVDHNLPENVSETELLNLIKHLNADKNVHGILVQLPLPKHINEQKIIESIDAEKDVDGFHPVNLGRLFIGRGRSSSPTVGEPLSGFPSSPLPCTPLGVMALIESTGVDLKGKNAVVVGRSNIVGKPVAIMLLEKHATVTICHSRTQNLAEIIQSADIVVAAIGKANFIKGDWIKKGAIVIDVGINRLPDGKIAGDVDFVAASKNAGFITPVPGGVGPMTIAMLMKNVFMSASLQVNKS